MNFSAIFKTGERIVTENSSAILTGVGVIGTVTTAVLAGKASFKAAQIIKQTERDRFNQIVPDLANKVPTDMTVVLDVKERTKLVWPLYLPAVGTGTITIASIIFANRISSKRAAALAAAYSLTDKSFQEYKEKTLQHLGIKKETALKDEIAQDRVNMHPIGGQTIIIGDGDVICYDAITGRYFMCNMEKIRKAENTINKEIIDQHAASLSSFYEEIGLPCTSYSDDVGWNIDNLIAIDYSTVMTDDGRPCIVIDFKVAPVTGYGRIY